VRLECRVRERTLRGRRLLRRRIVWHLHALQPQRARDLQQRRSGNCGPSVPREPGELHGRRVQRFRSDLPGRRGGNRVWNELRERRRTAGRGTVLTATQSDQVVQRKCRWRSSMRREQQRCGDMLGRRYVRGRDALSGAGFMYYRGGVRRRVLLQRRNLRVAETRPRRLYGAVRVQFARLHGEPQQPGAPLFAVSEFLYVSLHAARLSRKRRLQRVPRVRRDRFLQLFGRTAHERHCQLQQGRVPGERHRLRGERRVPLRIAGSLSAGPGLREQPVQSRAAVALCEQRLCVWHVCQWSVPAGSQPCILYRAALSRIRMCLRQLWRRIHRPPRLDLHRHQRVPVST
jgi:hypothetical protein